MTEPRKRTRRQIEAQKHNVIAAAIVLLGDLRRSSLRFVVAREAQRDLRRALDEYLTDEAAK